MRLSPPSDCGLAIGTTLRYCTFEEQKLVSFHVALDRYRDTYNLEDKDPAELSSR
jgi:hypothetical protein